jgi:altronate dehydratase
VTRVLVISARDNVGTAIEALEAGSLALSGADQVEVVEPIPRGHKVALREIRAGEAVIKFGSPIGVASAKIPAGSHVHTHNVASTRGRGDLSHPSPPGEGRIAEPPDSDDVATEPTAVEARQK